MFAVRTKKKHKQEKGRISGKKKKVKKNMCVVRIGLRRSKKLGNTILVKLKLWELDSI